MKIFTKQLPLLLALVGSPAIAQVDLVPIDWQNSFTPVAEGASWSGTYSFTTGVHPSWGGTLSVNATFDGGSGWYGGDPSWINPAYLGDLAADANLLDIGDHGWGEMDTGDGSSRVSYDFSGMTNGYLPAGSYFLARDIDANGPVGPEVQTFTSNVTGGSAWLAMISQGDHQLPVATVDVPTFTQLAGGNYSLTSTGTTPGGTDSNYTLMRTTQNITSLDIDGVHAYGTGFGIYAPVPEPSAAFLGLLTASAWFFRRRR